jgi:D-arabinose 1-dehydrogenase-like Zn-dependent alcohol dehydrogenase
MRFCRERHITPAIHATMPLADARDGFQALLEGDVVGKIVFTT